MATLLRQSPERVAVGRDVRDVEGGLAAASEWIRKRLLRTTRVLASASSPNTLTNLAESWQLMRSRLAAWNVTLTGNERQLERGIEQLDAIRTTWSATRTAAVGSSVPASLLERIDETLLAIVTARQRVGEERASVLALQERLFQEIARCDDVLATIEQARREQIRPLFTRDSPPLWRSEALTLGWSDLGSRLREAVGDTVELTRQFLAGHLARVPLQVALFVAVFVLGRLARVRRGSGTRTPSELAARQVLELPSRRRSSCPPRHALDLSTNASGRLECRGLLVLVPAVLIVRRLASPSVAPAIYALGAFFLADRVREAAWGVRYSSSGSSCSRWSSGLDFCRWRSVPCGSGQPRVARPPYRGAGVSGGF